MAPRSSHREPPQSHTPRGRTPEDPYSLREFRDDLRDLHRTFGRRWVLALVDTVARSSNSVSLKLRDVKGDYTLKTSAPRYDNPPWIADIESGAVVRAQIQPSLGGDKVGFSVLDIKELVIITGGKSHKARRDELIRTGRNARQKSAIPKWDRPVVVLGPRGYGTQDCLNELARRRIPHYGVDLRLNNAAAVIKAIRHWSSLASYLIIVQGGVDVGCFDEDDVVDALAGIQVPIVLGLGHTSVESVAGAVTHYDAAVPLEAANWVAEKYSGRLQRSDVTHETLASLTAAIAKISVRLSHISNINSLAHATSHAGRATVSVKSRELDRIYVTVRNLRGPAHPSFSHRGLLTVCESATKKASKSHRVQQERIRSAVETLKVGHAANRNALQALMRTAQNPGTIASHKPLALLTPMHSYCSQFLTALKHAWTRLQEERSALSEQLRRSQDQIIILSQDGDNVLALADLVRGKTYILDDQQGKQVSALVLEKPKIVDPAVYGPTLRTG